MFFVLCVVIFFFKQKTAYEMRISDWSSDVCSSDLTPMMKQVRFRTLGCYPLTGAIESNADTLEKIIAEMLVATTSERQGRVIDQDPSASMEKKKQRSEERRVGKGCVSTCRSRRSPDHSKKKNTMNRTERSEQ